MSSQYAYDNLPESFVSTTMLYIEMEINKVKFQAFVDSGAQSTIISKDFCEKVGLTKDIDVRFAGTAVGVGTSKILGRIHAAKLKLTDNCIIECSLQVLENVGVDFLFGLDMLKKHRCQIDLSDNKLKFTQEGVEVPFLKDHEILKKSNRAHQAAGGQQAEPPQAKKQEMVQKLLDMGATEEQATKLLRESGWDAEVAASMLFDLING